jgi:hypothetical protein
LTQSVEHDLAVTVGNEEFFRSQDLGRDWRRRCESGLRLHRRSFGEQQDAGETQDEAQKEWAHPEASIREKPVSVIFTICDTS